MIHISIYLLLTTIICFLSYKRWGEKEVNNKNHYYRDNEWVYKSWFWKVLIMTVSWPIAVPIYITWNILEKVSNEYFKKEHIHK